MKMLKIIRSLMINRACQSIFDSVFFFKILNSLDQERMASAEVC